MFWIICWVFTLYGFLLVVVVEKNCQVLFLEYEGKLVKHISELDRTPTNIVLPISKSCTIFPHNDQYQLLCNMLAMLHVDHIFKITSVILISLLGIRIIFPHFYSREIRCFWTYWTTSPSKSLPVLRSYSSVNSVLCLTNPRILCK